MANKRTLGKNLREDVHFQNRGNNLKVDRNACIIRDVKILGWKSKNKNRRYSQNGVDPTLYEGAVVNIDHADTENPKSGPRPLAARFGEVVGIHKNNDGLFAKELHYNPKHPLAESILWMAEQKPHLFGCSQNAFGDVYEDASGEIVETVTEVRSIDLVSEPATTKGLHEGVNDEDEDDLPPNPDEAPIDDAGGDLPGGDDDEIPLEGPPDADASPGADDAGGDDDLNLMDTEDDVAGPPDGAPGIDISDETLAIMTKVINSNLDPKAKKKKIASLIDTHHSMMQEGLMKTQARVAKGLKTLTEAKKYLSESKDPAVRKSATALIGTLDRYEVAAKIKGKKELAESLCGRAKLPKDAVTPHFIKQLVECENEREMMEAIEDRRSIVGIATGRKPKSVDPTAIVEGVTPGMSDDEKKKAIEKMDQAFLNDVFRA